MTFEDVRYTKLLFSLIAFVAFVGNAMVLCVLIRRFFRLKYPYHFFIFNLAVTDIITAVALVFSRYIYLPPMPESEVAQDMYCKIIWSSRLLFMLGYISVYTCLALSVERWFAVVKPVVYQTFKPHHAIKTVLAIWIWGLAISVPPTFRTKHDRVENKCFFTTLSVANQELLWLEFSLQSVIPIASMVILYCHILYTLKRLPTTSHIRTRALKRVTVMSVMASSALIIGWMPARINLILIQYGLFIKSQRFLVQNCLVILVFSNSCVNPFLYGIYSSQFRKEYKFLFKKLISKVKVFA